jgi:hypothetical protein
MANLGLHRYTKVHQRNQGGLVTTFGDQSGHSEPRGCFGERVAESQMNRDARAADDCGRNFPLRC